MPQIRSLLVDADGVIQLPSSSWRKSLESLCSDPSRIDEFVSEIFAAEQPCLTGTGDFASALTEVLANWDSPASTQQALDVWTLIEPDKDILSLLSGLRDRGLSVSLASNQQGHRASFMRDQLGYCDLFDELLFSCDIGHAKPSKGYFSTVLSLLGSHSSEALFIDDHEANVESARDVGLNAEVFHTSEGVARFEEILLQYDLIVA